MANKSWHSSLMRFYKHPIQLQANFSFLGMGVFRRILCYLSPWAAPININVVDEHNLCPIPFQMRHEISLPPFFVKALFSG